MNVSYVATISMIVTPAIGHKQSLLKVCVENSLQLWATVILTQTREELRVKLNSFLSLA